MRRGGRLAPVGSALFPALFLLSGCSGRQSALAPAGQQAGQIFHLLRIFFIILVTIYFVVLLIAVLAVVRNRAARPRATPITVPDPGRERRLGATVSTGVAVSVAILFFFLLSDFQTGQAMHSLSDPNPLKVKVTGHQWWWEIAYQDPTPSRMVTTANELHVPVGKAVQFELASVDVIHSFWAPNFHGKKDMVPGHPTTTWFRAEKPGVYRGQCAEYCGMQHAHMRLVVVAEPQQEFNSWLDSQRQHAPEPSNDAQKHGRDVFLHSTCIMCHTIQGTPARGMVGPDLTHLGSRQMLAAGTMPNTPGHLGGWIVDPQQIKPGVRMPQNELRSEDLRDLLDYLESLK